jgi:undecaprenyl-diphosphatase
MIRRVVEFVKKHTSRDATLLATMLIAVAGTLGFIELFDAVMEGDTAAFDHYVIDFMAQHRGPVWFQEMARDITALGAPSVLGLATIAVLGFLLLRRQYHAFWLVLVAVIGGHLIGSNIKELVGRERPTIFEHGAVVFSKSFPSGHAMMSAVVYLTLGSLLSRLVEERFLKVYVLTLAAALTFVIGVSRVYMGVHWPTDVLAGWTAGLVWALLCSLVARQLQKRGVVEKDTEAVDS